MTTTLKARVDALKTWHPKLPGYTNYKEETAAIINEQQTLLREAMQALAAMKGLYNTDDGCRSLPQYKNANAILTRLKAALEG